MGMAESPYGVRPGGFRSSMVKNWIFEGWLIALGTSPNSFRFERIIIHERRRKLHHHREWTGRLVGCDLCGPGEPTSIAFRGGDDRRESDHGTLPDGPTCSDD